jgi:hypothetical protein
MDRLLEIENEDHFEKDYEMVIAVSAIEPETPVILQAPDEIKGIFDGLFCKDNAFYGVPDKPGVYNCTVNFEFHQGYFEGYRADGESDWSFTVKTAHLVSQEIFKELEERCPHTPDDAFDWIKRMCPDCFHDIQSKYMEGKDVNIPK